MPDKKKGPQYSPEEEDTLRWLREQARQDAINRGQPNIKLRPQAHDLGLGIPPGYDLEHEQIGPTATRPMMPDVSEPRSEFMKRYVADESRGMLVPKQKYWQEQGINPEHRANMAYFDRYRREAQMRNELEREKLRRLRELDALHSRYSGAPGSRENPDIMPHVNKVKERTKAKVKSGGASGSRNSNPKTSLGTRG